MNNELITPEGQAFSDFVEGKDDNPYPPYSDESGRYNTAMDELLDAHQEAEG